MTADPLTPMLAGLVELPCTDGSVPNAVLNAPYCAIEPRSRRVFVSRRTDGVASHLLCLGSWEMFAELAVPVRRRLFKEYDLGAFMAMFVPQSAAKKVVVAATELPPALFCAITNELAALHQFNEPYYQRARVVGSNFDWLVVPPPAAAVDPLSAPTGITTEQLVLLLNAGWVIGPDRNDSRIAALLNRPELQTATIALNNKNAYWRMLQKAIARKSWAQVERVHGCHIDAFDFTPLEPLHLPDAVLIDAIPLPVLEQIIAQPAEQRAAALIDAITTGKIVAEGRIKPKVEYFVKAVGGASGNGLEANIARLVVGSDTGDQLLAVLATVRRQMLAGAPIQGLQLLEPVAARQPNKSNPCDAAEYFSPCLILRVDSKGNCVVAQAADQVLKTGTDYCGASFWSAKMQQKFLAELGSPALQALNQVIVDSGYVGYFGTDFVQNRQGQYVLVADGNARMNGNDVSYAVRNALDVAGFPANSACQCPIQLGDVPVDKLPARLTELFGTYRFDPATNTGVVLSPSFNPTAVCGESVQRKVMAVYCNPTVDRQRFDRFWTECFGG